eukprot:GHVU01132812.1.p1 GENE.GHVU01132812.1~~GHVU01132812.1.p1  ORF type:complete len:385 (+),score=34.23 GHVU01132812.1:2337-3491(+)
METTNGGKKGYRPNQTMIPRISAALLLWVSWLLWLPAAVEGIGICPLCGSQRRALMSQPVREVDATSTAGSAFSAVGRRTSTGFGEKTNEDEFLQLADAPCKGWKVYAVFDGHGYLLKAEDIFGLTGGSFASKFAKMFFRRTLLSSKLWTPQYCSDFEHNYETFFQWLFIAADTALPTWNAGTTATLIIHDVPRGYLYTGYVGDSAALLVQRSESGLYFSTSLTPDDHRPVEGSPELHRLKSEGHRVCYARLLCSVRTRNAGSQLRPWLNMARSIGDHNCGDHGKIPVPATNKLKLDDYSRFILMASDGLWDFASPYEWVAVSGGLYEDGASLKNIATVLGVAPAIYQRNYVDDTTVLVADVRTKDENSKFTTSEGRRKWWLTR